MGEQLFLLAAIEIQIEDEQTKAERLDKQRQEAALKRLGKG